MRPRVLVVDDSLTVRMDLRDVFVAAGFDVAPVATIGEARAALAGAPFAAIVLDVLLPDGDGIEFMREIKSTLAADVPVILLSTEAEVRDRVRGLKTGADEYVGKPYDATYVLGRLFELAARREQDGPPARPVVLVVEDGATAREAVRQALENAGYRAETAASGEEGLRLASVLRPAAMVIDGSLPGLDGAGVVRRVRQDAALRRTPCVMLTASPDPADELTALDAGADAYVRKGGEMNLLLARLAAVLRRREEPSTRSASGFLGPQRVLAVDDSLTYLGALERELQNEGYDVASARSGDEALDLLDVQLPDCILLDLVMPGLSGQETCRRIKSAPRWREIPLIILTALEGRDAMIEGINAGADDYIPKSADFDVLKARLRAQLRRKQFEDEHRRMREELLRKELVAAEARAARELAETRAALMIELERKNAELEAFSYTVSHDLRAPLRVIDGNCRILEEDHAADLSEFGRSRVATIRRQTRKMSALIEGLLRLARLERVGMQPETVDMTAAARAAADEAVAAAAGRAFDVRVENTPPARADRATTAIILSNLMSNAVKYTGRRKVAKIVFGGRRLGALNEYFVRDDGAGFDPAYAHKLFKVFQRLHGVDEFEGVGVGLATVRRLVERNGGEVFAEGRPGEGATFRFSLPAADCVDDRSGASDDRAQMNPAESNGT